MADFENSLSYKIAIIAIIGALYTIMVIVLQPISFFITQIRIADCLIPQVFIFSIPCVMGLTLGGFLGNIISPYPIDLIVGPLANFLAGLFGYLVQKRNKYSGVRRILWVQFAITIQTLVNVFVVGTILGIYTSGTISLPILASWWLGILIGSLIAMNGLGFIIYEAIRKTGLFETKIQLDTLKDTLTQMTRLFK